MTSNLLQRINRFLKESGLPPTVFGRKAAGDPRLVSDLRQGREPGMRLVQRVENFITHWQGGQK